MRELTWKCDGPNCHTQEVTGSGYNDLPKGWFWVETPDTELAQFCNIRCLGNWATLTEYQEKQ